MRVQDLFVSRVVLFRFIIAVRERANFVPASVYLFIYFNEGLVICMYILYIYMYKPDTHFYIDRFAFYAYVPFAGSRSLSCSYSARIT